MSTASNVSAGKPAVAGSVFAAPKGTELPTDATTSLNSAFKQLGYASEDGLTNNLAIESESIKAWGGDTVLPIQTSFEDTFGLTLIEVTSLDVLKTVFGSANVAGTLADGITIKVNGTEKEELSWVFDMVLRNGNLKRIVIPAATVTEIGEIVYRDSEAIGYPLTLTATPDGSGNSHYEYIKERAAS